MTKTSGRPGSERSGRTLTSPFLSASVPSQSATGMALTPALQMIVLLAIGSAGDDTFFINVFDLGARADIDAHFPELFLGEGRKIAWIARQDLIHRLELDD